MLTIRNQTCPNLLCRLYDIESAGNVVVHSRKNQRFQCSHCKKTWVAHRDSPFFALRTSKSQINRAVHALKQGKSVRQAAREAGVNKSTIQNWKLRFFNN